MTKSLTFNLEFYIRNAYLQKYLPYHSLESKKKINNLFYSNGLGLTVLNNACGYAFLNTDFFLCFTITQITPHLNVPHYSQYQYFLYETITEHSEKGETFDQIEEWLNKKGYLSVRGEKFKGDHIHSIVKKKKIER